LDIISYLIFFFPFWIVILIEGTLFAAKSWSIRETFVSVFAGPIYPIKTIIPVTAFLMLLQGLAIFIRKICGLVQGEGYGGNKS
jgi:TRAP-type mannitol/chloroaromatic compound transport system permease small subunit